MRLVSQSEFPISTTMTGALHAHQARQLARAALASQCRRVAVLHHGTARIGVFGSHGRARTEEFAAGDVGYVPQGYGHYIENTGTEDVEVLLVLNSGVYQSISLDGLDGGQSASPARHQFQAAGGDVRQFPGPASASCPEGGVAKWAADRRVSA